MSRVLKVTEVYRIKSTHVQEKQSREAQTSINVQSYREIE